MNHRLIFVLLFVLSFNYVSANEPSPGARKKQKGYSKEGLSLGARKKQKGYSKHECRRCSDLACIEHFVLDCADEQGFKKELKKYKLSLLPERFRSFATILKKESDDVNLSSDERFKKRSASLWLDCFAQREERSRFQKSMEDHPRKSAGLIGGLCLVAGYGARFWQKSGT